MEKLQAMIFDMDGVLINSEPFWKAVEMEVFQKLGADIHEHDIAENVGLKNTEVVANLCAKFNITHPSQEAICDLFEQGVVEKIKTEGEAIEGLYELLEALSNRNILCAIATSSSPVIIRAVMDKLKLQSYFRVVCSAYDETYGKPHPAVYITTAQRLGFKPMDCWVIEDSINGVLAAKAAKMKVIAMPEYENYEHPHYAIANRKIKGLGEVRGIFGL